MDIATIETALNDTKGWDISAEVIRKHYTFKNFVKAMEFMNQCAVVAEENNHHPEWKNIYNNVWVELRTHDAGNTVTEKDTTLANAFDAIAQNLTA